MAYKWLFRLRAVGLLCPALLVAGCAGGGGSGDSSAASAKFADITWVAPSERDDGSPLALSEISGYRVYYGEEAGIYPNMLVIDDSSAVEADLVDIPSGDYFAVVTTVDTDGRESVYSVEVKVSL